MAAFTAKFGKLLDEFWDWRMKEFPEFAYFVGWKGKDHRGKLESYKVSAFEERKRVCEDYISRAQEMKSDLADADRMNCESFIRELQDYVDGSAFKGFVFPINFLEGIQHELGRLAEEWLTFDGPEDYDVLLETYKKAVPQQVDEIIELMRYGIKEGMVCHAVSMTGVVSQFDGLLAKSLEGLPLLAPLKKFPSTMSEEDQAKYETAVTEALKNAVFPALKKLRDFIADEYSTKFRPEIGSSTLPPGMAFYEQCLRFHTSTNFTPKQIHQMGLDEVERIETEMREIIKEAGSDDDIKTFMDKLREDKSFYCKSKEELMARFRELCDEIEPMLIEKKIFYSLPKSKLALKESRPEQSGGPAAEYLSGTPDGSRPGVFYVNSNNYTHQPTYEMIPLALHEANPGHHLQGCYAMEKGTMPYFRQYLEDRKYSDTPSRFPMHTAYIEGWGLYSETLGHDLGLYKSPYDRFGHLSEDIFRACRLVVDTGLHAFGWTQEQAVQFMLDHSAASKENIENEVRRYITWPGQACAYKIGQLKLIELRRRATEAMKEAFDIRDFHEIVLCNNGHLDILERAVDEYIGRLAAVPRLQETHAGGVGVISGQ